MKATRQGIALVALLCGASISAAQTDLGFLAKRLQASVVTITSYDKDNRVLKRGIGFFISATGDIVTSRLVFPAEADHAEVRTSNEKSYRVMRLPRQAVKSDLVQI